MLAVHYKNIFSLQNRICVNAKGNKMHLPCRVERHLKRFIAGALHARPGGKWSANNDCNERTPRRKTEASFPNLNLLSGSAYNAEHNIL